MGLLTKFDLKAYMEEYNAKTFIETGTCFGEGVQYAATFNFDKIYSIEYMESFYLNCKKKFSYDSRIEIINNKSTDGLIDLFENNNMGNIVFWLDAHYPYDDHNSGELEIRLPLEMELEIIKKYRKSNNDVILIDDLRIYEEGNFSLGNLPQHIDRTGYGNIEFVYKLFSESHTITKDYEHQGYIILIPKQK
jgi:hypothetical protein